MAEARRDQNFRTTILAVSSVDGVTPVDVYADPVSHRLLVSYPSALVIDKTITPAGTTGARTINKGAGSVNFAAGAGTLVVTNSLVNTSSVILATVGTVDMNMMAVQVVAASGSFTLVADVPPAAETRVNFLVIN